MDFKNEPSLLNSKEKTFVYLWTYTQFQEQAQWGCVNKLLQKQGFQPVHFTDPVENKNISDLVLLDRRSAAGLRLTVSALLGEWARSQALVQELLQSNNLLKDEAQQLLAQAGRCAEMEALLARVGAQVRDLEGRCLAQALQQRDHAQSLQQDTATAQRLAEALQLQLTNERAARGELKGSVRGGPEGSQGSNRAGGGTDSGDVTSSFKAALKSCQAQLEEARVQRAELKAEVQRLRKELDTRPPTSGAPTGNPPTAGPGRGARDGALCGQYRRLLMELEAMLTGATLTGATLTGPRAPGAPLRQRPALGQSEPQEFGGLRPALEAWANQLAMLRELRAGLLRLSQRLMPWLPAGDHDDGRGGVAMETVRVEDLMLLVETLLVETETEDGNALSSPTRHSLHCMVRHFQTLFDVGSLRGVFPHMTLLHRRMAETANAMTHLRDLLGLDNTAPPSEVVNQVATMASSPTVQFHRLLAEGDLTSIIVKVKEHEEFFPAFHSLATQLMLTLEVDSLDGILPALTSLKLKSE